MAKAVKNRTMAKAVKNRLSMVWGRWDGYTLNLGGVGRMAARISSGSRRA
jgi:hypothetical protein